MSRLPVPSDRGGTLLRSRPTVPRVPTSSHSSQPAPICSRLPTGRPISQLAKVSGSLADDSRRGHCIRRHFIQHNQTLRQVDFTQVSLLQIIHSFPNKSHCHLECDGEWENLCLNHNHCTITFRENRLVLNFSYSFMTINCVKKIVNYM